MTTTFEAEGFEELEERLAQSETFIRINLNEGLREIGQLGVPILKRHTPIGATADLRNKTRFQVVGGPADQQLQIRQGARSQGGFFYGRVVRGGRRAGRMPPPSALIPWVIRKLGVSAAMAPSVAFAVARKIGRRGLPPKPYHKRALAEMTPGIQRIVNQRGLRVTAQLAGEE